MKIKKDDKVIVLSGKDKGKIGKVISADPKNGKVIVEGVNVATKHQKAKKQGQDGGIIKVETPSPADLSRLKALFTLTKYSLFAPSAAQAVVWATSTLQTRSSAFAVSAAKKSEKGDNLL